MKRPLFLSVLLMSVVICGTAFAESPEHGKVFTFTGVIKKDTSQTEFDRKTFGQLYAINNEWWPTFFEKDLKNVSQEFRQCIDDLKYQGVVDIPTTNRLTGPELILILGLSLCSEIGSRVNHLFSLSRLTFEIFVV